MRRPDLPPTGILLTDLYQLTMLQAYFAHGLTETAAFELFVRKLPQKRGFLMAAGLAQVVEFLESLRVSAAELDWLASTRRFEELVSRPARRSQLHGRPRRAARRYGVLPR